MINKINKYIHTFYKRFYGSMCGDYVAAPVFQPAPSVLPVSNTSLNVTWISAEPSTQLRGVARNYSVYYRIADSSMSPWQVRHTATQRNDFLKISTYPVFLMLCVKTQTHNPVKQFRFNLGVFDSYYHSVMQ